MVNAEIKKNLKHGYVFLIGTLLAIVVVPLSLEIYLAGGIQFTHAEGDQAEEAMRQIEQDSGEIKLEIQNLQNGYKTQEENISIVGFTEPEAQIKLNDKEFKADIEGRFEQKIDLVVGTNLINIVASKGGKQSEVKLEIVRGVKEEVQKEPEGRPQPATPTTPKPQQPAKPNPAPQPTPTPPVSPPPSELTGLKMSCSISNTQPFVGNTLSVNCTLKDQNNNPVSGGFGYVTVNWQSGTSVYTMSQSNNGGAMSVGFQVPAGNNGQISGSVRASKSGLNVSSNFAINVN